MRYFNGIVESVEAITALTGLIPPAESYFHCCGLRLFMLNPLMHNLSHLEEIHHILGKFKL